MTNSILNPLDLLPFAKNCKDFDIDLFDENKHGFIQVYSSNNDQSVLFLKEVELLEKDKRQNEKIEKTSTYLSIDSHTAYSSETVHLIPVQSEQFFDVISDGKIS